MQPDSVAGITGLMVLAAARAARLCAAAAAAAKICINKRTVIAQVTADFKL